MHDPDIVEGPAFDAAARAAEDVATDLDAFHDRLDRLGAIESEIAELRAGIADASLAARDLAGSAERSAAIHEALELAVQAAVARHEETLASLAKQLEAPETSEPGATFADVAAAAAAAKASLASLPSDVRIATDAALERHRSASLIARWEATWLLRVITALVALTFLLVAWHVWSARQQAPSLAVEPLSELTVQVLNGTSGRDRPVAGQLADVIRTSGRVGSVLDAANAAHSPGYSETTILTHGASMEAGRELAEAIGVSPSNVFPGTPAPLNGDLTVVVGDDIDLLGVLSEGAAGPKDPPSSSE